MPSKQSAYFGLNIILIGSFVAGICNTPFNVMPMILGSAADGFNLSPQQTGLLGGATLMGWVAGTALCFFILKKANWRHVSIIGLLVASTGVHLSLVSDSVGLIYLAWFILGVGCSLPTCVVFEVMAHTENPERSFGLLIFSIVVTSAAVLYVFPLYILPEWHYTGLVNGFSFMILLMVLLAWKLPAGRLQQHEQAGVRQSSNGSNSAAWIAIAVFLVFFAGQSGLWAFLERAGREIDLPPADIGVVLAILKVVGGLACVVTAVVATRYGNRWPYIVSFVGIVISVYLLDRMDSLATYAIGSWIWEFFFTLVVVYLTAEISRLDKTGQVVVLMPGAIGLGGASGPAIAGFLKTGPGFMPVYGFAVICAFICMCTVLILINREDKKAMAELAVTQ